MKKLLTFTLAVCVAAVAFAQPRGGHKDGGARPDVENIKAEKVAYITSEVGLTSKEAEAFWPLYNGIEDKQQDLQKAEREASKALTDALEAGQETKDLLDKYIKAKEANVNLHLKAVKDYRKVLPEAKLAKFYLCEERFLRRQAGVFKGGRGRAHGPEEARPGRGNGAPGRGPKGAPDAPKAE